MTFIKKRKSDIQVSGQLSVEVDGVKTDVVKANTMKPVLVSYGDIEIELSISKDKISLDVDISDGAKGAINVSVSPGKDGTDIGIFRMGGRATRKNAKMLTVRVK